MQASSTEGNVGSTRAALKYGRALTPFLQSRLLRRISQRSVREAQCDCAMRLRLRRQLLRDLRRSFGSDALQPHLQLEDWYCLELGIRTARLVWHCCYHHADRGCNPVDGFGVARSSIISITASLLGCIGVDRSWDTGTFRAFQSPPFDGRLPIHYRWTEVTAQNTLRLPSQLRFQLPYE